MIPMDNAISGRYSRQVLLDPIGNDGQAALQLAGVVVIGCGALGTVIAERLARAGVGRIRIVDRDFVELDNLQRQALFTEEHAHQHMPKAVAAQSILAQVNSEIEIEPVIADATASNIESLLESCSLAMDATDNLETRFLLNDACLKAGIPWVHGAAVGTCGQVMPIVPGETACYRCYLPEPPSSPIQGCDVLGVLNTVTGVTAEIQCTHALRILTGNFEPDGNMLFFDLWEGEFQYFNVDRRPDCPACVRGDYEFLRKESASWATSLCGRNAVQITPAVDTKLDLVQLAGSLGKLGEVEDNGYLLIFRIDGYEITIFPNGRAMVKGTTETQVARSLYSRYVGI